MGYTTNMSGFNLRQPHGTIRTKLPAADLARLFLGATLGIRVLARTNSERELLTGVVRPLFALLRTK